MILRLKICLVGAVVFSLCAGPALGQDPAHVFRPTKDFVNFCDMVFDPTDPWFYNFVSTGADVAGMTNAFCGMVYSDFDRDALRTCMNGISPDHFRCEYSFVPRPGGNDLASGKFALASWYAGCDWTEGDGQAGHNPWSQPGGYADWYSYMYNWSAGTTSAGKWSPEMKWKDDGGGPEPDFDNMSGWKYPDGTELTYRPADWSYNEHKKGIEELWFHAHDRFSSEVVLPEEPAVSDVPWTRYSMSVDDAVIQDLLDPIATTKCQGLRLWGGAETADHTAHDTAGMSTRWVFMREASAVNDGYGDIGAQEFDYRPYLDIRLLGDSQPDGNVDLLDLTIIANNWELNPGSNQWGQGDFNGDGNVDLLDLTLLANNWELSTGCAGAAVPEPASLVVLCVAALALIRRRR